VRFLFLIPIFAFSIYPFLQHPPFFLYSGGFVVLDSELSKPSTLTIFVMTDEDSFLIVDPPSKRHRLRIPVREDFEYSMRAGGVSKSGRIVFPSPALKSATLLVYGDTRGNTSVQREILKKGGSADFLLFL
jgi:hypothetical protein